MWKLMENRCQILVAWEIFKVKTRLSIRIFFPSSDENFYSTFHFTSSWLHFLWQIFVFVSFANNGSDSQISYRLWRKHEDVTRILLSYQANWIGRWIGYSLDRWAVRLAFLVSMTELELRWLDPCSFCLLLGAVVAVDGCCFVTKLLLIQTA